VPKDLSRLCADLVKLHFFVPYFALWVAILLGFIAVTGSLDRQKEPRMKASSESCARWPRHFVAVAW